MKAEATAGPVEQMPAWAKVTLVVAATGILLVALALLPLPIPPYLDFQVLYQTNMGLLRGIGIYDHPGQVQMIAQLAHVAPDQVFVLPFPYPPWYALSTLWLAWIPIASAVRIWLGIGLVLLFASIWFLTDGWAPVWRLASFFVAILFPPVLGSLFVGQYDFPVLMGAAMMTYALVKEKAGLAVLAAALLTFKPHVGGPVILAALAYLWLRKDAFGRRAIIGMLAAGAALFAVGFLASPVWPLDYLHSLTGFKNVSQCNQCVNPSMMLAGMFGGGFDQAVPIAAVLLLLAIIWLAWKWKPLAMQPDMLISTAVLMALFVSPYLQNYDYVLLVAPGFVLARRARGLGWLWLALAFLLPLVGLSFFGVRAGFTLVLSVVMLLGMQGYLTAKNVSVNRHPPMRGASVAENAKFF